MVQKPGFGNSENDPVHLNQMVRTKIERGDRYSAPEVYDMQLTVLNIIRGHKAVETMQSQDITDQSPKAGYEFILVKLKIGYFQKGRGFLAEPYTLTEGQLVAMSSDGKIEFELPSIKQQPQPPLVNTRFSAGETHEGWIVLQIPITEKKPLMIFRRQDVGNIYGIWGSVWFELYS